MANTSVPIITNCLLLKVLDVSSQTRDQALALLTVQSDSIAASTTPLELSTHRKVLNTHLAHLRTLNRTVTHHIRSQKALTASSRQEVDRLHLQLQNLYYKQHHLRGEIAACEGYPHKYQELPLLPLDAFLMLKPELVGQDEDEVMKERIEYEYREREELEQARQGLLKKKQAMIVENKRRRERLAQIDREVEVYIEVRCPDPTRAVVLANCRVLGF